MTAISLIDVILYLAATMWLAVRMRRAVTGLPGAKWGPMALGLGAALVHAAVLYRGIMTPAGLNLGFFNALSLVTWCGVLLMLLAALTRPVENLGIAIFPFAALASVLEPLFPSQHIIMERAPWPLEAHILISVLSYSLLSIAAVHSVLLAVQDRHLHNRHPGGIIRALPPLQTMESLLFQMIAVGFVLLSVALLTGIIFLEDIFAQHLVHKTVLSIAAWMVFGTLLWGRWRHGWRGRTAIRWTLGGFITLMLAYFGSKLVLELVLGI